MYMLSERSRGESHPSAARGAEYFARGADLMRGVQI
jgi:hypothetical protein